MVSFASSVRMRGTHGCKNNAYQNAHTIYNIYLCVCAQKLKVEIEEGDFEEGGNLSRNRKG